MQGWKRHFHLPMCTVGRFGFVRFLLFCVARQPLRLSVDLIRQDTLRSYYILDVVC